MNPLGVDKDTLEFIKALGKFPEHEQKLKIAMATLDFFEKYFVENKDKYDYTDLIGFTNQLYNLEQLVNEHLDSFEFPIDVDLHSIN